MTEQDATIQDLQRSLEAVTTERDELTRLLAVTQALAARYKDLTYSFASAQAKEFGGDVFQIIEDEARWIEKQRQWDSLK